MKQQTLDKDLLDIEGFETLASLYKKCSKEVPDNEIDRQIIAAAHRELESPKVLSLPKVSWWRRLSLPVYAATAFSFMALATHVLWEEPARTLPGTSPSPVNFELAKKPINLSPDKDKYVRKSAPDVELLLPQPETNSSHHEIGVVPISDSELFLDLLPEQQLEEKHSSSNDINNSVKEKHVNKNGTQIAKAELLSQKEWARKIIELYKKGHYESAQESLLAFKKAYPDYPIDEQVEIFRR